MRACTRLWMLAPVLVLAGCATVRNQPPPATPEIALTDAECNFADALAHYGRGFIAEAEETPAQALAHFQAAADRDTGQTALALQLAARYLVDRRYAQAIGELEKIREQDSGSAQTAMLLAYAYQGGGRLEDALREYRRLIRLTPTHAEGYIRAARVLLEQEKTAQALNILESGLRHAETPTDILRFYDQLGRIFAANSHWELAIRCYRTMAEKQPQNLLVKDALATLYISAGQPAKAIVELNELTRQDPENREVTLRLGEAYAAVRKPEQAEQNLRLACAREPPLSEAFLSLAAFYAEYKPEKVAGVLEEGLRRMPKHPSLYAFRGLMHIRNGEFKEAIEAFVMAEAVLKQLSAEGRSVSIPRLQFWHGMACERDGQYAQAVELLQAHIKELPDAHEALNYLAYMWAEKGTNLNQALEYAQRALALSPGNAAYLDTLGWIYYQQGGYAQAQAQIGAALALLPDDPVICDHMGDVSHALNKEKDALKYWRKSYALAPANAAVAAKLKARGIKLEPAHSQSGASSAAPPAGPGELLK